MSNCSIRNKVVANDVWDDCLLVQKMKKPGVGFEKINIKDRKHIMKVIDYRMHLK